MIVILPSSVTYFNYVNSGVEDNEMMIVPMKQLLPSFIESTGCGLFNTDFVFNMES